MLYFGLFIAFVGCEMSDTRGHFLPKAGGSLGHTTFLPRSKELNLKCLIYRPRDIVLALKRVGIKSDIKCCSRGAFSFFQSMS